MRLKFDAWMSGNVFFIIHAIPLHRLFRDGIIFQEEQIVMPKPIDCMVNIYAVIPRHDKPSQAALLKQCKRAKNREIVTVIGSRCLTQLA